MAISDTLFDAAKEIRRYLKDMPEVYAEVEKPIQKLLADMDAVRIALDKVPGTPSH
jgi:hypothetical protein